MRHGWAELLSKVSVRLTETDKIMVASNAGCRGERYLAYQAQFWCEGHKYLAFYLAIVPDLLIWVALEVQRHQPIDVHPGCVCLAILYVPQEPMLALASCEHSATAVVDQA